MRQRDPTWAKGVTRAVAVVADWCGHEAAFVGDGFLVAAMRQRSEQERNAANEHLATLPAQLRLRLPGGAAMLGVHASPGADDGPGIDPGLPAGQLRGLLAGCGADVVVGGHTHDQADRLISGIRALNPGSTAMPRPTGQACWLLLQDRGRGDLHVEHRTVPYDAGAVARDLHRRRHPSAAFIGAVLTGQREQYRTPSATAR